jgi:hypothetical protein
VIAGIDYVTGTHTAGEPAVANMSLGGAGSDPGIENAVRNSIADGVVYAIASGNSSADACNSTPARVAEAITVNSGTSTDARSSFSNFARAPTSSPRALTSRPRGTPATPPPTRSAVRRWPPRTSPAPPRSSSARPRAPRPRPGHGEQDHQSRDRLAQPSGSAWSRRPSRTGNCSALTNTTDVAIADLTTVESPIAVSGCPGNATATAQVDGGDVGHIDSWAIRP